MFVSDWMGGQNLVVDEQRQPRLWLSGDRVIDALGVVRRFEPVTTPIDPIEIAIVVAEWLVSVSEKEGDTPYANIHPELRAAVFSLVPSVVMHSDEDERSSVDDVVES